MGSTTSKSVYSIRKPGGSSVTAGLVLTKDTKRGTEWTSPSSISTHCPSKSPDSCSASSAVSDAGPLHAEVDLSDQDAQDASRHSARWRLHWQKLQDSVRRHCYLPEDLSIAAHIWELWGLDKTLDPAFARNILKVLLRVLRLYHLVDFPDGDVAWVLAHATAYGHRLGFAQRARSACAERRADFCIEVAMVFFLAQTHLCDEPCFAPTYLKHVLVPLESTLGRVTGAFGTFGSGRSTAVDQRVVDQTIMRCFQGMNFRLDVARPHLAIFYRSLGGSAKEIEKLDAHDGGVRFKRAEEFVEL